MACLKEINKNLLVVMFYFIGGYNTREVIFVACQFYPEGIVYAFNRSIYPGLHIFHYIWNDIQKVLPEYFLCLS